MKTFQYLVVVAIALALVGCNREKGSVAKQAGAKVGETLTDFASGVGSGIDTKLTVPVELSEALKAKGLSTTVAKTLSSENKGFVVYVTAEESFSGNLLAKAINAEEQEVGRSMVEAVFETDDAKYVTFTFPKEMDSALVAKYTIDFKKPKPVYSDTAIPPKAESTEP